MVVLFLDGSNTLQRGVGPLVHEQDALSRQLPHTVHAYVFDKIDMSNNNESILLLGQILLPEQLARAVPVHLLRGYAKRGFGSCADIDTEDTSIISSFTRITIVRSSIIQRELI